MQFLLFLAFFSLCAARQGSQDSYSKVDDFLTHNYGHLSFKEEHILIPHAMTAAESCFQSKAIIYDGKDRTWIERLYTLVSNRHKENLCMDYLDVLSGAFFSETLDTYGSCVKIVEGMRFSVFIQTLCKKIQKNEHIMKGFKGKVQDLSSWLKEMERSPCAQIVVKPEEKISSLFKHMIKEFKRVQTFNRSSNDRVACALLRALGFFRYKDRSYGKTVFVRACPNQLEIKSKSLALQHYKLKGNNQCLFRMISFLAEQGTPEVGLYLLQKLALEDSLEQVYAESAL